MKTKRKHVTREQVARNAEKTGSKRDFFRLPRGVKEWSPEKAGEYLIDHVVYETKSEAHPDNVEPGTCWYKYPFQVHKNVGPNNIDVICPGSVGRPCPICQERARLAKDWDANADAIKALNFQTWAAYPILDPDDKEAVAVMALSYGKYAKQLQLELAQGADSNRHFYEVTNGEGRTLRVRVSNIDFATEKGGAKYLGATRFDFVKREDMDEEAILTKAPCLDECLNVMAYDKLKALFLQIDSTVGQAPEGADTGAGGDTTEPAEPAEPGAEAGEPAEQAAEEPVDPDASPASPAETTEATAEYTMGQAVQFKVGKNTVAGEVVAINENDYTVKDAAGKRHLLDISEIIGPAEEIQPEAVKEPAEPTEPTGDDTKPFAAGDMVDWGTGTGEFIRLNAAGRQVLVLNDAGVKEWVPVADLEHAAAAPAEEPEEPAEPAEPEEPTSAPAADGPAEIKKGSRVSWLGAKGKVCNGTVTARKGDELSILGDDKKPYKMNAEDLIPFEEAAAPAAAAPAATSGGKVCPHKGGTFGKDFDKFGKDCDACPTATWNGCEKANGAAKAPAPAPAAGKKK